MLIFLYYLITGFDTSLNKLSTSHTESGFASMHSLRSSSQSYTSSQQFSSRSSQQSSVSYTSSESNKVWQMQSVQSRVTTSTTQSVEVHSESTALSPEVEPPALPQKTRSKPRQLSTYDNVPSDGQHIISCSMHQSNIQQGSCRSPDGKPPPLPLKKKHSKYV